MSKIRKNVSRTNESLEGLLDLLAYRKTLLQQGHTDGLFDYIANALEDKRKG